MTEQFRNGYGLLIGVSACAVEGWSLPQVAGDIKAVVDVLTHPDRCAYLAENVKIVTGVEATRANILDGLAWLREKIQADTTGNTTAFLYYSGHGWQDTTTDLLAYYLIPYDVRSEQIRERALAASDFATATARLTPQRLLVVLDCCHAGGMGVKALTSIPASYTPAALAPQRLLASTTKTVQAYDLLRLDAGQGRAILSSSQGEQRSYLRRDGAMSIFTYHLIEALTGHAQPVGGAKEVLVSDVMSHVSRRVPQSAWQDAGAEQQPDYEIQGNFPIALLLGGKGLSAEAKAPDPLQPLPSASTTAYTGGDYSGGDKIGGDKISIKFRDAGPGAQIAGGHNIRQTIVQGYVQSTAAESVDLQRLLNDLRTDLAALSDLPQRERILAEDRIEQIAQELTTDDPPQWSAVQRSGDWLLKNVPSLIGSLGSLFLHPLVARLVEVTGDVAAAWVRDRFSQKQ